MNYRGIMCDCTYVIYDPKSGEAVELGYVWEGKEVSFRELVSMLRNKFIHPSECPGIARWASTESEPDCQTGYVRIKSLHSGKDARSQRYWTVAWKFIQT